MNWPTFWICFAGYCIGALAYTACRQDARRLPVIGMSLAFGLIVAALAGAIA